MNIIKLRKQLQHFFLEDIGEGDLTSQALFQPHDMGAGYISVKEDGVISGIDIIREGYALLDGKVKVTPFVKDGDFVRKGTHLSKVEGPMSSLLTGERVLLNLLQRMSGIATLTHQAVTTLNSQHTKLCDTRKTTPGLRMFEKYAVTCGGGYNHRFGLYDGVMIKDNHIAKMGSITKAVEQVRRSLGHMVKIEVETETEEQVREAVEVKADIIMFDNCTPDKIVDFIKLVPKTMITEASGGISMDSLASYGETGVDFISLGFLTHSSPNLDISFNLEGGKVQ